MSYIVGGENLEVENLQEGAEGVRSCGVGEGQGEAPGEGQGER